MTPETLAAVMEATWPPAATRRVGPWRVRDGQGGGKRVSAATAEGEWTAQDIPAAEAAMAALGQAPLFLIRSGDEVLDLSLADCGYGVVDLVVAYSAPVARLVDPAPSGMAAFAHWPPLAIARTIWEEAGIGPARIAVMARVSGPHVALLGRTGERPSGAAFVAIHRQTAMLHALEVVPSHRRQGSAQKMVRAAAVWAQANGADTLSLVVAKANTTAVLLYASLGMEAVGQYHYRQK